MKRIGSDIYIHISNIRALNDKQMELYNKAIQIAKEKIVCDTAIVKINLKQNCVSLIECHNWDSAREPEVGDAYKIHVATGEITKTPKKKRVQIYHHKHLFVSDDYTGFNIAESKAWSEKWTSILPATRELKSRIGFKDTWEEVLKEYNLNT